MRENMDLVRPIAARLAFDAPASVTVEDLESPGMEGLLDAARKFDARRGVRFRTYAPRRILGAILDEMRRVDWVPRILRSAAKRAGTERDLAQQIHIGASRDGEPPPGIRDLADRRARSPEESVERREDICRAVRALELDEKLVMVLYYIAGWTMKETGELLGVSESRVCQVHRQALEWLHYGVEARAE